MKKLVFFSFLLTSIFLQSCSVMKVSDKKANGYFTATKSAKILTELPFELDDNKQLLVVQNEPFMKGMAEKIGYFDQVITFDELEKEIIKANMQDEVGSLIGKIGINTAYRKYKKFLFLKIEREDKNRIQLKLINPETFEEIFIADTKFDLVWAGVNDNNTFNPLFNALIQYIKSNSNTFH
ncbi:MULTISPECIES: hypothetical protein [unclassified Myroides]|uniref:hypothetical protein n=1 Tax=unclassified Myroides TaxID=2642485 RepID=UPI002574B19D|nr:MULTISPECIES: hypothetical protein [unclassified Myroides]